MLQATLASSLRVDSLGLRDLFPAHLCEGTLQQHESTQVQCSQAHENGGDHSRHGGGGYVGIVCNLDLSGGILIEKLQYHLPVQKWWIMVDHPSAIALDKLR